jgi:hypothetical protein
MRFLIFISCAIASIGCDGPVAAVDAGRRDAGSQPDAARPEGCALPVPFDEGATYERTLHVSTTGDDGADGSASAPLASIEEAARRATPGTRIVLAAGTYSASWYVGSLNGEEDRPIAIAGEGEVILDAGGQGEALHVSNPRYVVIENLTIQNATGNGINIDDGGTGIAEHVVLRDLVVRNIGTGGNNDCVKLSGLDRFFVIGGDLSGCNAGDAIDMVGCHDGVIRGVHIHDTPAGGIQAKGGSSGTIMHGNLFTDVNGRSVNAGGSTGDEFFRPIDAPYEAQRLYVVANVFVRSGADSGAPIAYVGCDGCVFANNTVIEPRTWVARILQERTEPRFVPCRDGVFANNLVLFDVADLRTYVNVGGGTAPETFSFHHNLWWAQDDASFTGPDIPAPIPPETGSVIADPMLVDAAGGDFHPSSTSRANGAGAVILEAPPYPDYEGRCFAEPGTIGAFQAP